MLRGDRVADEAADRNRQVFDQCWYGDDLLALRQLGLITSHGFYAGTYGRWFGEHKSAGIDKLREKRPELHAWVTSTSWSKMDAANIKEHHGNIYTAKVNGIIAKDIAAINEAMKAKPSLINTDPYGEGWFVRVKPTDWAGESASLVTGDAAVAAYQKFMEEQNINFG